MEIRLTVRGLDKILFFVPDDKGEANVLEDFAPLGEPLTAVIKKAAGYRHLHLEVRREDGK